MKSRRRFNRLTGSTKRRIEKIVAGHHRISNAARRATKQNDFKW